MCRHVMGQIDLNLRPRHHRARTPRAVSRLVLVACVIGAPLGASSAQPGLAVSGEAAFDETAEIVPLTAEFAGAFEPIGTDTQGIDPLTPDTAVDLDSFEPPLEQTDVLRYLGSGVASFYGRRFHGRMTANGERFDMGAMTAAHKTLPFGSLVRVTNPRNGRSVTVRINDRGPFTKGRTIDLSRAAAEQLGMVARGHASVELELVAP